MQRMEMKSKKFKEYQNQFEPRTGQTHRPYEGTTGSFGQPELNDRRAINKDTKSKEYQSRYEQSPINQHPPIIPENKPTFKKHPRIQTRRNAKQNKATEYSEQHKSD